MRTLIRIVIIWSVAFSVTDVHPSDFQNGPRLPNPSIDPHSLRQQYNAATAGVRAALIERIKQLTETENPNALSLLGDIYLEGEGVPVDGEKAAAYFERAAAAGSTESYTRLGDLYRDGTAVPADLARSVVYYQQGVDADDSTAMVRLGEALIRGKGVDRNAEKGFALVNRAASIGNSWALSAIGDYFSRGDFVTENATVALRSYEAAGALGNVVAYVRLGEIYRDGVLVPRNFQKSISYYKKAINAGHLRAMVQLAQNYIDDRYGNISDKSLGLALIEDARARGEPTSIDLLFSVYLRGIGVPKNPKKALDLLKSAADAGNGSAVRRLISLYRDGLSEITPQNVGRAEQLLLDYQSLLKNEELVQEKVLILAAAARQPREFQAIVEMMYKVPPYIQSKLILAMRTVNANAYTYVVQDRLKKIGLYGGNIDGMMTLETIRAIKRLCNGSVAAMRCNQGPLGPDAARFISLLLS